MRKPCKRCSSRALLPQFLLLLLLLQQLQLLLLLLRCQRRLGCRCCASEHAAPHALLLGLGLLLRLLLLCRVLLQQEGVDSRANPIHELPCLPLQRALT